MQALADNGAHFWLLGKGWMEDPQEALQTPQEEYQRWLEGIQNGRELMYTVLEEGETEGGWQAVEKTYTEVRGTYTKVVIQIAKGSFIFLD